MNVGFPSQGFFADNGGEFANNKLDKLPSKLGLTVRFGSSYSPYSINKLGYSPLQLVTGKAVMVPGLMTGNVATKSMLDSEAVRRIMENLMKITSEFWESDMTKKLKEYQDVRVYEYQH